eukprot:9246465-Pyramimonas_sp.AAC.1
MTQMTRSLVSGACALGRGPRVRQRILRGARASFCPNVAHGGAHAPVDLHASMERRRKAMRNEGRRRGGRGGRGERSELSQCDPT